MQRFSMTAVAGLTATCLFFLAGCGGGQPAAPQAAHDHHHDHGHEGPHGGHIIELGSHDYHAELTHDDASHRVGVYLLDGRAASRAPIAAESVSIIVKADDESQQFELSAAPHPDDPPGTASYFEITSETLCDIVCGESEAERVHARLSLTIDEKPYVGVIDTEHHHHHHDHDHDHAH